MQAIIRVGPTIGGRGCHYCREVTILKSLDKYPCRRWTDSVRICFIKVWTKFFDLPWFLYDVVLLTGVKGRAPSLSRGKLTSFQSTEERADCRKSPWTDNIATSRDVFDPFFDAISVFPFKTYLSYCFQDVEFTLIQLHGKGPPHNAPMIMARVESDLRANRLV